ncbi:MAG: hypothetical protein WAT51_08690, partial [Holophaga sp.]
MNGTLTRLERNFDTTFEGGNRDLSSLGDFEYYAGNRKWIRGKLCNTALLNDTFAEGGNILLSHG